MMSTKRIAGAAVLCAGLATAVPVALGMGPAPGDDSALTARGRAVVVDVLANDPGMASPQSLTIRSAPAHGTASIVGTSIRYVPAAGFTGRDTFTYFVKKGRSAGLATVTVDVGEALVLRGRVTDGPIADAGVSATVDGRTFTATADADGHYSLEIIGTGDGMVTLAAAGTGKQSTVRFASVLGDFDRVLAEAGSDGELTRDENNQVQVTNLSTAQSLLLERANGGQPVTDDEALVMARESLDNGELLTMAAAIKLSVDGGYPLPAGTPDTLALISDPEALLAFLGAVDADDPAALGEAINAVAADPEVTVPSTAQDLAGTYTLAYNLGLPGTIDTGYIQGERLTLDADGGGSWVTAVPNGDPALEWSFDPATGRAVATPLHPTVMVSYPVVDGLGQIRQFTSTTRIEVARLFEGAGRDTLAITRTTTFSYPDHPQLEGGTQVSTNTNLGIRDDGGIVPFTAGELAGSTRSMWISGVPYANSNYTGAETFDFASGGTGTRGDGQPFSWSIDGLGRLAVAYPDGTTSVYGRVQQDGRKGESLAGHWRASDGTENAALSISARADGSSFTPANAAREWRSGQFVSRLNVDPNNADFFLVFAPGGNGWHVSYTSTEAWPTRIGWTSTGGLVDAVYYRDGNNQPVHACQVGVDGCYVWQVRQWRPVATDGDRVYVIEQFLVDYEGNGQYVVTSQRGNFYDASTAPPFPQAGSGTARPAKPAKTLR